MRILLATANPPSPIRVRSYEFVRALGAKGHDVTVATPVANDGEVADADSLRRIGVAVMTAPLAAPRRTLNLSTAIHPAVPFQARYAWQPGLAARLADAVQDAEQAGRPYDVVHVEHLRAAAYGLALLPYRPVLWDAVDSITDLFEQTAAYTRSVKGRLVATVELNRTRRHEGDLVRRFDWVVATSTVDREALLATATARDPNCDATSQLERITVVPNGVDLVRFRRTGGERPDPNTIVLSGKLSYHANVTAAVHLIEVIMPLVWSARPSVQVVLAGAAPSREVLAAAAAHPGRVTVTGFVPDLAVSLHAASVAVAPMVYGVGIQNKVLEAMACGIPVVASPVAVRALSAEHGREVLVADDAQSFAREVISLLEDPNWAAAVGAAGRAYVEREHAWSTSAVLLEQAYERARERYLARRRASSYDD